MNDSTSQTDRKLIIPMWINGKEDFTSSTFPIISPTTNSPCWHSISATPSDALRAVSAASAAFPTWSKIKPTIRRDILLKAADILEKNLQENAGFMATEMGADIGTAMFIIPTAINMCRDIASRITSICGSVPVCQDEGTSAVVYKEPYGVTLGIVPWNAPYVFGIRSAATAIATGNTTILKASEFTPRCYWAIGKAFHEAGLPPGVLNILSCRPEDAPEIANVMIEHPAVRKIDFTGSASVGRKIARICGQNLKPCLMELGGKNSAIILPDADIEKAVRECIAGSFLNSGQICMATDRIIIHSAIAPAFLSALKNALSSAPKDSGLPTLVSSASKQRLETLVSEAVSGGAEVLFDPNVSSGDGDSNAAATFGPTVLGNLAEDTEIWNEEVFGPLVGYKIVQSEEEAVSAVNSTGYGLSAAVFTKDLRKGLAVARRIESGAVHINSMTIHDEPTLPFGGVKNSGWGRFNAQSGMEEFLFTKTITWDD